MRSFYGNFLVMVKAYAYIRSIGPDGLERLARCRLERHYIMRRITEHYDLPYDRHCMHEFVVSLKRIKKETGVHTMDISKRLLTTVCIRLPTTSRLSLTRLSRSSPRRQSPRRLWTFCQHARDRQGSL